MKLDGSKDSLNSLMGTLCTLVLLVVLAMYTYLKGDTLIKRKDVDILSTVKDMHYSPEDEFSYKNGFNFAVAFTAYDSNPEPILDPTYGEIIFNHYEWGPQPDGSYMTERRRINSHTCSREELGLDGDPDKAKFLPVYEDSLDEVDFYSKKF